MSPVQWVDPARRTTPADLTRGFLDAFRDVLRGVFHFAGGLLDATLHLVALALSLEVRVVHRFTRRLLHLPLRLVPSALGSIAFACQD